MNGDPVLWTPGMNLDQLEKLAIIKAYQFFRFNKTATANSLGISVKTLDTKLEQYDKDNGLAKEREEYEARRRAEFLARSRGQVPDNVGISSVPTPIVAAQRTSLHGSPSGVRVEPLVNAAEKSSMPVPERKEVQAVLPNKAPQGSKGKNR